MWTLYRSVMKCEMNLKVDVLVNLLSPWKTDCGYKQLKCPSSDGWLRSLVIWERYRVDDTVHWKEPVWVVWPPGHLIVSFSWAGLTGRWLREITPLGYLEEMEELVRESEVFDLRSFLAPIRMILSWEQSNDSSLFEIIQGFLEHKVCWCSYFEVWDRFIMSVPLWNRPHDRGKKERYQSVTI